MNPLQDRSDGELDAIVAIFDVDQREWSVRAPPRTSARPAVKASGTGDGSAYRTTIESAAVVADPWYFAKTATDAATED